MDDQFLTDMYYGQQTVSVWVFRTSRVVTFFSGLWPQDSEVLSLFCIY